MVFFVAMAAIVAIPEHLMKIGEEGDNLLSLYKESMKKDAVGDLKQLRSATHKFEVFTIV